jgi:hypothetical protein
LRWVVVSHPGEFLRSSSTAKLAPLLLPTMEGDTCELLAYGAISHAYRLTEAIAQAGPHIRVLFPGPPHLTDTVPVALAATAAAAASASLTDSECGEGEGGDGAVDLPPLTILVPDGAWQSARVLALELLRLVGNALGGGAGGGGGGGARFVGLAGLRVAAHTSAVMEMLRQGAGRGRRAVRTK